MEAFGLPGTEENCPRVYTLVNLAHPFLSKVLHSYITHLTMHYLYSSHSVYINV